MRRWVWPIVLIVIVGGVVGVIVGSSGKDGSTTGTVSPTPAVTAANAPLLPKTTTALPSFQFGTFQDLLTQLQGTPVVVNVWGSWCGPCREEAPRLAAAARRFGRRVQFLGLDVKDTRDAGANFIQQMHWPYPSIFDPSPNADLERRLGYFAQPVTLFYDRAGRIVDQVSGPVTTSDLQAGIRKILR